MGLSSSIIHFKLHKISYGFRLIFDPPSQNAIAVRPWMNPIRNEVSNEVNARAESFRS